MKKEFETPVCEVVEFENEDILTASGPITNPDPTTPGVHDWLLLIEIFLHYISWCSAFFNIN